MDFYPFGLVWLSQPRIGKLNNLSNLISSYKREIIRLSWITSIVSINLYITYVQVLFIYSRKFKNFNTYVDIDQDHDLSCSPELPIINFSYELSSKSLHYFKVLKENVIEDK